MSNNFTFIKLKNLALVNERLTYTNINYIVLFLMNKWKYLKNMLKQI